MRPVVKRLTLVILTLLVAVDGETAPNGQSADGVQEIRYEVRVCRSPQCVTQMPLVVSEVRIPRKEDWWRDLEVEIKNVSSRPIYYILLRINLPDTCDLNDDHCWGVASLFGRSELLDLKKCAGAGDAPLNPGESHVFKINKSVWPTFSNRPPEQRKRVRFIIQNLSFGDGTGIGMGGVPLGDRKLCSTRQ